MAQKPEYENKNRASYFCVCLWCYYSQNNEYQFMSLLGNLTYWRILGSWPPSLSLPHPATVPISPKNDSLIAIIFGHRKDEVNNLKLNFYIWFNIKILPINKSSFAGKQIGIMLSWKSMRLSNFSNARSFSYVKKLYFGWTIFLAIFRSMLERGSLVEEKSHSPIRTRILATSKLFKKTARNYDSLLLAF